MPESTAPPPWTLRGDLELFGLKLPEKLSMDSAVTKLRERPCTNSLALVSLAAYIFYQAEKGHNPKVRDIYDALIYTSTAISVGYGDIFAHTTLGKLLGSVLMTLGPALAAKTLDGPEIDHPPDNVQMEMLTTLKHILAKLEDRQAE